MFKSSSSFNNSFFGDFAFQTVIDRNNDHILVKIKKVISFQGLNELVSNCYSKDGRYAYQPEKMLKILLIQFLYDYSDREIMIKIDTDIIYRWFIGISLDDEIPHFTRLGDFKDRLGKNKFEDIFNRLVKATREAGIISDELRIIDTTDQRSRINLAKLKRMFKKDDNDKTYIDRHSPDKEASFGKKERGKKGWYGYKPATLVEPDTQIVTAMETVPANIPDQNLTRPLIEKEENNVGSDIEDLGGDKGFLGEDTRRVCQERNINDYIIPRKNSKNHLEGKDSLGFHIARYKRPAVERTYACPKRKQGLGKCRYLGVTKTSIQNLITFMAYNLKRITIAINEQKARSPGLTPPLFTGVLCPFLAD